VNIKLSAMVSLIEPAHLDFHGHIGCIHFDFAVLTDFFRFSITGAVGH